MRSLAASFLVVVSAASCLAHDTWLSPSAPSAKPGEKVSFDLTSGMKFPKLDSAIKPERVARSGYRIGEEEGTLTAFKPGKQSLRVEHSFKGEGLATVWLQLHPRDIEMGDKDVAHYFEEIRPSEEVQRAWAAQKGKRPWKELYTKCAKTFVTIGDPAAAAADDSWREQVGLTLELMPLQNPTTIRVGEPAKFRLLRNSRPVAGAALVLQAGGGKPRYATTDDDGVATCTFDKAGPTMITNVQLRAPEADAPWQSEFTTLTFEVKR